MLIKIRDFTFEYSKSSKKILDNISLDLDRGQVLGIIGRNGSGKSTLLNILSTNLLPNEYSENSIIIDGQDLVKNRKIIKNKSLFISGGERGLYYNLTGSENLELFGYINKVRKKDLMYRIREALRTVGLEADSNTKVVNYSLGMKQRLHLSKMLIIDPEIILLDEPTNGLDINMSELVLSLVKERRKQGAAIIYTSHRIDEIAAISDSIMIIEQGKNQLFPRRDINMVRNMSEHNWYIEVIFDSVRYDDNLLKEYRVKGTQNKVIYNLSIEEFIKRTNEKERKEIVSIKKIENFELTYSKIMKDKLEK
ncbi:ABC transporter ATP-binding protein [Enterococcus casseliflavus]|uniref:ABC transporter ATP-binding protein n=1 Tax=Enterococcus casseliflavus TaxID=37734 RepID=UPI002DB68649|nr:ABC transporter ATP-binding protein [Enterococcus casseliflavus]MEB6213381.1 ABC transporter ATP-binding protein [Enterococcus casseliflavus]